ncbi:L,D-transpeptidase family protein [Aquisalimonas lutea]|uniref:L,D-transpeptidase family protein n=1 Tax=Aquisalimonas lutea TaxID=1327750 RepID=UPI0025B50088|nr:L,D-transpeptidase family protein [Aquisalimonas lutea]MDN3516435.1 L,D-transpeptidase family protein [Aquisalimonas lutea]
MKRLPVQLVLLVILGLVLTPAPAQTDAAREALRYRLESIPPERPLMAGTEPIPASQAVRQFYQQRLYEPAWVQPDGSVPYGRQLVRALMHANRDGLPPEDYRIERVNAVLDRLAALRQRDALAPRHVVDAELILSGTWMTLGSHSLLGRTDPKSADPQWRIARRGGDLPGLLQQAVDDGAVYRDLRGLLPQADGYARLRRALARYRGIAEQGGFEEIPAGPTLCRGDQGERVALLRRRLAMTDDTESAAAGEPDRFDAGLEQAVRRFQARHGLEEDGVVGRNTLAALNVPAGERVQQIRVNMERWRWLPQELGERYIMVNIAGFDMTVVDDGEPVMTQRVVVGRDYRQTPVFSGRMTYLVLNPAWEVPHSIAVRDLLPQIRQDPEYFHRMGFQLFQGWGAGQQEIDPATVDWQNVADPRFPYRFRQRPGPLNALGTVKFMFPNEHAVYLHDTPARDLFQRADRAFSSGCIRVEQPRELIDLLLADSPRWPPDAVREALDGKREQTVPLPQPIPVHLQYMTAWVDDDGRVHLRKDIYNRDGRVAEALDAPPPERGDLP